MDESYYTNDLNYSKLCKLKELIICKNTEYKEIIKYIINNKININSYIKIKDNFYAPLFYLIIHAENQLKLFKWIHSLNKINYNLKYDYFINDIYDNYIPHYLTTCKSIYLKYLFKNEEINNELKKEDIIFLLKNANIDRIKLLNIDIKEFLINDKKNSNNDNIYIEFIILEHLIYKNITYICATNNNKKNIDFILNKYLELFKYIDIDPYIINKQTNISFIQTCIDWYLLNIIEYLKNKLNNNNINKSLNITFYKDINEEKSAIYRQLYNDYNYYNICKLLNFNIDERVY